MCYPYKAQPEVLRTAESFKQNATEASEHGKTVMGIHGKSVVAYMPGFSPSNIVIDYMHGVLLGITKGLLKLWIDGRSYQRP